MSGRNTLMRQKRADISMMTLESPTMKEQEEHNDGEEELHKPDWRR